MKFFEQNISQLEGYLRTYVSDNKEYWMGFTMDHYGVYFFRYGRLHNYVQYLMEIPLGRQKNKADDSFKMLSNRLFFIAEHNNESIHSILPDVRATKDNTRFLAEVEMLTIKITQDLKKQAKEKKHKQKQESVSMDRPKATSIDISALQFLHPQIETIEWEETKEHEIVQTIAPDPTIQEPPTFPPPSVNGTLHQLEEDEEEEDVPEPTRPIIMPFDDLTKLVNAMRPVVLAADSELDYDLMIVVRVLEKPKPGLTARGKKPKTLQYNVKLGKYFRVNSSFTRTLKFVLPTTAPFEGVDSAFLCFNEERHQKDYPNEVSQWPKTPQGLPRWTFESFDMAKQIIQSLGLKIRDKIVNSRTRIKMHVAPVKIKESEAADMAPKILRIVKVTDEYESDGIFKDEDDSDDEN